MPLYLSLIGCAFLAGWLVYRYDMYDRESWPMMLLAVAIGAGAMWVTGRVELFTYLAIDGAPSLAVEAIIPATHEEGARLLVVLALALLLPSQFNDPMDGIIYGSLVGLGMAMEESLAHLAIAGETGVLPPTEIIRVVGHLTLGGITGFGVGMFRMRMNRWLLALIGCVGVSIGLHFCWDLIAFRTAELDVRPTRYTIASVSVMLGSMLFFGLLVVLASEWSRRIFAPNGQHRLWGWPFTLLMRRDTE